MSATTTAGVRFRIINFVRILKNCARGRRQTCTSRPSRRLLRSAAAHSVAGRIQTAKSDPFECDILAKKTTWRYGGGKPTSLCDLGYCDVGLDDHWQECGSPGAAPGMHYHDVKGNPIINKVVFPDLGGMAKHAHGLGLTSGWYVSRFGTNSAHIRQG